MRRRTEVLEWEECHLDGEHVGHVPDHGSNDRDGYVLEERAAVRLPPRIEVAHERVYARAVGSRPWLAECRELFWRAVEVPVCMGLRALFFSLCCSQPEPMNEWMNTWFMNTFIIILFVNYDL